MRQCLTVMTCGVLLLSCVMRLNAVTPAGSCNAMVTQRVEMEHTVYEISGDGFAPGEQVRIDAINQRSNQGYVFLVTPSSTSFSGVLIGKDPDGFFYRVSPGIWKVAVRGDVCSAKTRFAVSGVANGTWGGENEALITSDTGARFARHCAEGFIDEPLAPNSNGDFDVAGRYRVEGPGPDRGIQYAAQFRGSVDGEKIELT
ncbi:MAG TPA: hypothetical protein VFV34_10460, partial [Blastocatellia bacterium]|nr:hypothetical protein [Blastocatellia bacterium]